MGANESQLRKAVEDEHAACERRCDRSRRRLMQRIDRAVGKPAGKKVAKGKPVQLKEGFIGGMPSPTNLLKYLLQGLAIALAAHYIPKKGKLNMKELAMLAGMSAATMMVLDLLAPKILDGFNLGTGFGIGMKQVGM